MALSPSIPTSFVPKQPVSPTRKQSSGNNIFLLIALVLFVLTLLTAGGVFLYSSYLKSLENTKAAQLLDEKKKINPDDVDQFIRLKNRLVMAQTILNQHIELTQFFDIFEKLTLAGIRFNSLSIQVAQDRSAILTLSGEARSFNTLAAQSQAFAAQPYIKSAIFSNINPNSNNKTVSFSVTATLDKHIVVASAVSGVAIAPTASSTDTSLPSAKLPSVTSTGSSTQTSL